MAVADSPRSRTGSGPAVVDGVVTFAATTGALWSIWSWLGTGEAAEQSLDQSARIAVLLLGAGALSLLWHRRAPVAVLAATGLALLAHELVVDVSAPVPLVVLIALCAVAGASPRPVATGSAVAIAGFVAVGTLVQGGEGDEFVDFVLLTVVAWMLGSGNRVAQARCQALEQETELVRGEHEAQTALALEQERARIARELHDVVAHHVCVMVAQARAGQAVLDDDRAAARQALQAVEGTGREALTEMRRLLDLLRPEGEQEPVVSPQPGLDQLPVLVAQVAGAGLPVQLEVRGSPRHLPAGVELNAYRIVQESLTNALKHGPRAHTRVVLTYGTDALEVQVDDVGTAAQVAPSPGRGLMGMRQRAALLGGDLHAGPRRGGGFSVDARLPVTAGQATDVVA